MSEPIRVIVETQEEYVLRNQSKLRFVWWVIISLCVAIFLGIIFKSTDIATIGFVVYMAMFIASTHWLTGKSRAYLKVIIGITYFLFGIFVALFLIINFLNNTYFPTSMFVFVIALTGFFLFLSYKNLNENSNIIQILKKTFSWHKLKHNKNINKKIILSVIAIILLIIFLPPILKTVQLNLDGTLSGGKEYAFGEEFNTAMDNCEQNAFTKSSDDSSYHMIKVLGIKNNYCFIETLTQSKHDSSQDCHYQIMLTKKGENWRTPIGNYIYSDSGANCTHKEWAQRNGLIEMKPYTEQPTDSVIETLIKNDLTEQESQPVPEVKEEPPVIEIKEPEPVLLDLKIENNVAGREGASSFFTFYIVNDNNFQVKGLLKYRLWHSWGGQDPVEKIIDLNANSKTGYRTEGCSGCVRLHFQYLTIEIIK